MTNLAASFDSLLADLHALAEISAVTALRYEDDRAVRIYSSDPARFPDRGAKTFNDAPTMARVRDADGPVMTEGAEALERGFADWQAILAHGCDAIVNLPVRLPSGEAVGQLNLIGKVEAFPETTLSELQIIADTFAVFFQTAPTKGATPCVSQP